MNIDNNNKNNTNSTQPEHPECPECGHPLYSPEDTFCFQCDAQDYMSGPTQSDDF